MRRVLLLIALTLLATLRSAAQSSYTQTGEASYYADKFHGRTTASGERYDKNKLTCAHLSLPFGTILRVTSLDNNRTTVVRVNDRGPFSPNRIIDLSRRAAEALGIVAAGKGRVRIEVVGSDAFTETSGEVASEPPLASAPPPAVKPTVSTGVSTAEQPSIVGSGTQAQPSVTGEAGELFKVRVTTASAKGYAVQLASYQEFSNLLRRVSSFTVDNLLVYVTGVDTAVMYKMMVGPYHSREQAEREKLKLEKQFPGCFIVQL